MKIIKHGFTISYDDFTDTLYISEGMPQKAKSVIDDNYILVRRCDDKICGITIDGFASRHKDDTWDDSLILKYLPTFIVEDLSLIA